jgi:hypothetical protein
VCLTHASSTIELYTPKPFVCHILF